MNASTKIQSAIDALFDAQDITEQHSWYSLLVWETLADTQKLLGQLKDRAQLEEGGEPFEDSLFEYEPWQP